MLRERSRWSSRGSSRENDKRGGQEGAHERMTREVKIGDYKKMSRERSRWDVTWVVTMGSHQGGHDGKSREQSRWQVTSSHDGRCRWSSGGVAPVRIRTDK